MHTISRDLYVSTRSHEVPRGVRPWFSCMGRGGGAGHAFRPLTNVHRVDHLPSTLPRRPLRRGADARAGSSSACAAPRRLRLAAGGASVSAASVAAGAVEDGPAPAVGGKAAALPWRGAAPAGGATGALMLSATFMRHSSRVRLCT